MYHADLLGGIAARLAGTRNVTWGIHNSVLVPGQNSAGTIFIARICAHLSYIVPRAIICCAHKAAQVHTALGYRAAAMHVVPNGYDLTLFQPDPEQRSALRAELKLGDEDVIGFVARYDPAKDHANLLRALAILKARDACPLCLLVGGGMEPSNAPLIAEIARHDVGDRVLLLGRRGDVPAIMNALDVHVLSSAAEAFPNVLAEAMACGTPCVSTNVGDAADIVGESGWIAPPGDPEALADAIEAALAARRSADWSARRERARQWIARSFSIAQMSRGYRRVWNGDRLEQGADGN
jgi:glycosyltransferase involved in cell wall biosynthesis